MTGLKVQTATEATPLGGNIKPLIFTTDSPPAVLGFFARLPQESWAPEAAAHPVRLAYFDTFDWRLYRRGLALVREKGAYKLLDRKTGSLLAEQSVRTTVALRFARDFESGPLGDRLQAVLKFRALLHLVSLKGTKQSFEFRDPGSRRVWRIGHRDLEVVRGERTMPFRQVVTLQRVGGGGGGGGRRKMTKVAMKAGLEAAAPTLLEPALSQAGIVAASYTRKVRIALEADESAGGATLLIARNLLKTMKTNLGGVRQDIDVEFLHDLRVAVRRTRSLIGMVRGVWPEDVRRAAKNRFADLGDMTGPIRDMDVFLMRYEDYREMLPPDFQPGLDEIFSLVVRRRRAARSVMVDRLTGDDLRDLLLAWERFLQEGGAVWNPRPPRAGEPIGPLAGRIIAKRYARVQRWGRRGQGLPSDEDLHRLRVACKKLRYALEFFAALYSARQVDRLVRALKKLQDQLGEHNDLATQLTDLRLFLDQSGSRRLSPPAAAAVGALMISLGERKKTVRARVGPVCSTFMGPTTAARVERLVGRDR